MSFCVSYHSLQTLSFPKLPLLICLTLPAAAFSCFSLFCALSHLPLPPSSLSVTILPSSSSFPHSVSSLTLSRAEVVVEFEYEALHDDELTLRLGDIIKNVRYIEEDGWMEGDLNGKRGLFPDNFVKVRGKLFIFGILPLTTI